jgi:hypothetical protein
MSVDALSHTTLALQRLLHAAVSPAVPGGPVVGSPDEWVTVGSLDRVGVSPLPVSLFLFHIEPNREMRNASRFGAGAGGAVVPQDSLAVDVRYLVSVHREASASEPTELARMGRIMSTLQGNPTLTGAVLPGQEVRLTPEPYPMEELSRVWSLFPQANFRLSVVYLAAPVFIDAAPVAFGPPVASRRADTGQAADPPDIFGRRAEAG